MAITQREETIWNMIWLLVGVPTMIAGIVVGACFDDLGLMIGAPLAIALILFTARDTLLSLLERIMMFGRSKERKTLQLSVVDQKDSNRVGVLRLVRGHADNFRPGSELSVLSVNAVKGEDEEEMKVYVIRNGRVSSAGTLSVRNGNFQANQSILVQSVEVV